MFLLLFIFTIIQIYNNNITVECRNATNTKHFFKLKTTNSKLTPTGSHLGSKEHNKKNNRMLLVMATNFCHEHLYLEEWIIHYYNEGVEHFYMYDQCNSTLDRAVLQPYIDNGLVSLTYDSDVSYTLDPYRFYNRIVLARLRDIWPKWLITSSIDEYYFAPHHSSLIYALQDVYNSCNGVLTPGIVYGSNGIVSHDGGDSNSNSSNINRGLESGTDTSAGSHSTTSTGSITGPSSTTQSYTRRVNMSSPEARLSGFNELKSISKVINLDSIDSKTLRHRYKPTHRNKHDLCMSWLKKKKEEVLVDAEVVVKRSKLGYKPYLVRVDGSKSTVNTNTESNTNTKPNTNTNENTTLWSIYPDFQEDFVSKSVIVMNVYKTRSKQNFMSDLVKKQYNTINGYKLKKPIDSQLQMKLFMKFDQNVILDKTLANRRLNHTNYPSFINNSGNNGSGNSGSSSESYK